MTTKADQVVKVNIGKAMVTRTLRKTTARMGVVPERKHLQSVPLLKSHKQKGHVQIAEGFARQCQTSADMQQLFTQMRSLSSVTKDLGSSETLSSTRKVMSPAVPGKIKLARSKR